MDVMEVSRLDRDFADEVERLSQAGLKRCYACRTCGNGCPFVEAMEPPPYGIIRMVLLGMREEALASPTIWICVNCHTCSSQCPMGIDIAAMMNALCHLALKDRAKISNPDILDFHLEVLRSMESYGRTHKLGIMLRHKLSTGEWLKDLDLGLKMFSRRKLELFPSKVKAVDELNRIFLPHWKARPA